MPCCQNVQRRPKNTSRKSGAKSGGQHACCSVLHVLVLNEHLFILIIACQLCAINNAIPKAIGRPASPKAFNAFMLNYFNVTIHSSRIMRSIQFHSFPLVLQSNFNHICRVCHRYSYGTCHTCCNHFLIKRYILSFRQISTYQIFNRLIEPNTNSRENDLPMQPCSKSIPQSPCSLLSNDSPGCAYKASVLHSLHLFCLFTWFGAFIDSV